MRKQRETIVADSASTGEQVTTPAPATQGKADEGVMIPKSRFDEVLHRAKEAERTAEKLASEKAQREQDEAIKRGEFEKVLAEKEALLATLQPKAALADQIEAERRAELLERLPETERPFAADLDMTKLRSFVALRGGAAPAASHAPVSGAVPGSSGANVNRATPEEIRANQGKPGWLRDNFHRMR